MELTAGTVVAERFRLVRLLGEGGMGSVWLAHHEKLDTACAVKFINADVASAAGVKERFEREAKIAAQIKSPHVVHVLDYGVSEGVPYIAMEYLEGEDLAHRLTTRGRLSPQETLAVVAQIARALVKAHAAGLVHRDLKPENVYLVRDDDHELVKVLDFGIAKAQTPMADAQTRTGVMMGTPRYMSPEQAQGMKTLDHRSDLWSLGVIAYRCVVGALPFDSDAMGDLMMRIIVHPLPVPSQVLPGLPPSFDAWWMRAAARDPAQRFQNAKELSEALAVAFGMAAAISGPAGMPSSVGGSTPMSSSQPSSPAFAPVTTPGYGSPASGMPGRAITPPTGAPMSPTMVGAPTMMPGTPGYVTGAPAPAHTMSPASRTFTGAEPAPRKAPVALIVVSALLAVTVLGGGAAFFLLRGKTDAAVAIAPTAAPTAAATAEEPKPTVAPVAIATEAPSASAAPTAAPAVSAPPKTVVKPKPVAPPPPPPPARTGKVKIPG